jgi:hypothetical protein
LSSARCVGGAWDGGPRRTCGAVPSYHDLPREAWVRLCANPCGDVLWACRCEVECFRCFFFGSCHGCVRLGWQDGLDADPVHPSQKRVYLGKANIDRRSNPVGPPPFMQAAALLSRSSASPAKGRICDGLMHGGFSLDCVQSTQTLPPRFDMS